MDFPGTASALQAASRQLSLMFDLVNSLRQMGDSAGADRVLSEALHLARELEVGVPYPSESTLSGDIQPYLIGTHLALDAPTIAGDMSRAGLLTPMGKPPVLPMTKAFEAPGSVRGDGSVVGSPPGSHATLPTDDREPGPLGRDTTPAMPSLSRWWSAFTDKVRGSLQRNRPDSLPSTSPREAVFGQSDLLSDLRSTGGLPNTVYEHGMLGETFTRQAPARDSVGPAIGNAGRAPADNQGIHVNLNLSTKEHDRNRIMRRMLRRI